MLSNLIGLAMLVILGGQTVYCLSQVLKGVAEMVGEWRSNGRRA